MADHPKFREQDTAPGPPKNILVSGCAKGIGRCLARTLLQRGHRVFLLDIDRDELLYCANTHLQSFSSQLGHSVCDLRDVSAIRSTAEAAARFFDNRIDVLIHNGGIASPHWRDGKTMEDPATLDEWKAYIETNLTAPFALSQACIPYMKVPSEGVVSSKAGPCIILVGSFRAHQSDPNQEGYASSKAGLLGLMHSMAISGKDWGIRVNLIAPGRIKVGHESREGDEVGHSWEDTVEEKDVEQHPANRAGRPMDVYQAVEYLMDAGFVTAQEIMVDGGASKRK